MLSDEDSDNFTGSIGSVIWRNRSELQVQWIFNNPFCPGPDLKEEHRLCYNEPNENVEELFE